jgi:hypothetical protein
LPLPLKKEVWTRPATMKRMVKAKNDDQMMVKAKNDEQMLNMENIKNKNKI